MFDPLLRSSSAGAYCPCSVIMYHERINGSGRCNDKLRNQTRQNLHGIAEAAQYTSVALISAACRKTVDTIHQIVREPRADQFQLKRLAVLNLLNEEHSGGSEDDESSRAWGDVFKEIGQHHAVHLQVLFLAGMRGNNSSAQWHESAARLTNLQFLEVVRTTWQIPVPATVGRLTRLRKLAASHNRNMESLPSGLLVNLVELKLLYLGNNSLSTIPSLEKNTGLRKLYLDNNRLTKIPSLEKNTGLTNLKLENNHLTSIPSLEKNTGLTTLNLNTNHLTSIPSLEKNIDLSNLYLANNRLARIPSLEKNTGLKYLNLYNNELTSIPSLMKNTGLTILKLQNNHLSLIPSLETNVALKALFMQSNRLTTIPSFVNRLPRLKLLDVSDNAITSLDTLRVTTTMVRSRLKWLVTAGRQWVCVCVESPF